MIFCVPLVHPGLIASSFQWLLYLYSPFPPISSSSQVYYQVQFSQVRPPSPWWPFSPKPPPTCSGLPKQTSNWSPYFPMWPTISSQCDLFKSINWITSPLLKAHGSSLWLEDCGLLSLLSFTSCSLLCSLHSCFSGLLSLPGNSRAYRPLRLCTCCTTRVEST